MPIQAPVPAPSRARTQVLEPAHSQTPVVYRIAVSGTVENGLAPYIARSLREAEAAGAAAAYLDIDTPGGRIDAAERISDAIRRSPLAVYAFVNPRAFIRSGFIQIRML